MSNSHEFAAAGKKLNTKGVYILAMLALTGFGFAVYRLLFGIGPATNLSNAHPWGIWIAIDVATGVALAAGGFTSAALVYVFRIEKYHPLIRAALLTAMLGYTFVVLGLMLDLGRYYNIWHPMMPWMWSGHSVLFEVGICFMAYITVLYIEFLPIFAEGLKGNVNLPGILSKLNLVVEKLLSVSQTTLNRFLGVFIIAGIVLSCLHQSSLGTLMLIAPSKMHALWFTPILPWLFLLSAICVGFPMIIFEAILASKAFKREPEMHILSSLARFVAPLLVLYAGFKIGDLAIREQFPLLLENSLASNMFLVEIIGGVLLPCVLLFSIKVRNSTWLLFSASTLVILGVALNRINVFLIAYTPVYADQTYFPSVAEIAVTVGLISALILLYRVIATFFPVLPVDRKPSCAA